jgi:hypothetical protein
MTRAEPRMGGNPPGTEHLSGSDLVRSFDSCQHPLEM